MKTLYRYLGAAGVTLGLVAGASACGGDDDSGDAAVAPPPVATDSGPADLDVGGNDELALGDPCELVPADVVSGIVGADATASLTNVGDGLPGATCAYTVEGGTISLSITPGGADFFDSYRAQAEAGGGIEPVDGLGDEGFVFQGVEVVSRASGAMIQLQMFTSASTAATGGVDIVKAAVEAIAG